MAGVAINGSEIAPIKKEKHVTYTIQRYECVDYDEEGFCISRDWVNRGSGSTDAKITGTISATSQMKINGVSVAKVSDPVNFSWIADPPVPSNTSTTRYVDISPSTSGSGTASIINGGSKGKLGSSSIALIGSQVEVLGVITTISSGNTKMNFSS